VEFGLPMNFQTLDQFYEFHYEYKNRAYLKLLKEVYRDKGIHFLAGVGSRNAFHTKFPVYKVEDLKNKKIRTVGLIAKVVKALGGVAVNISPSEQYMALQRGTVDGTANVIYGTRTYKLMEVTKYIILPPVYIGMQDLFCNLDEYNKLPPDLQKIVDEAAEEAALNYYRPIYMEKETADLAKAKAAGVKLITLPAEEYVKIRNAAMPVWDESAAKTPNCSKMVDLIREYVKEKGVFSQ